ncbi:N-terminal nucleophile aminohydrolase [Lepidopterella palustris CBS 459.81]|uniref:N-terminal nucleophile aminohydrolase n=1 Tax=Lepidopterella palustris CBS 459.81 TaxID=1314670 RepID=A0A8E2EFU8_9PEZI|nr:N-terminal nucleophile aminohydrolase [Lepidopterella palustris CBS 459.81]
MFNRNRRNGGDISAIFVHAGAGYHSVQNESIHLQACNDAAKAAMMILRNGGTSVDAVEMAVKILEDREITNAGYGSNLAMDGVVECDASIVDHYGRSGAVGAVAQVKNPISLARLVLEHTTKTLSLRRVPPNLLVSQGATDFAFEQGMPVLPHDALVSPAARERWLRWKSDLKYAERKVKCDTRENSTAYKIKEPSSKFEDQIRKKQRDQHTKAMLGGAQDDNRSISPTLSDAWKDPASSPSTSATDSSWKTQTSPPTPQSWQSWQSWQSEKSEQSDSIHDFTDPRGPPRSIHEPSKSAYITSIQKVTTLANCGASYRSTEDQALGGDLPMSDIGDTEETTWAASLPRHSWGDGSSGGGSSASSDTMQLPSLTPSPPPPDALEKPLPETPPEKQEESPTPFASTPLGHVTDSPPFPLAPRISPQSAPHEEDSITDTVGAIAIDSFGNIACGASSGGIGMKYRGRVGPAALVGVGAAVVPLDPDDKQMKCVATVTSGTGEHMATTMAATVCAERLYHGVKRVPGGTFEPTDDDSAIKVMIDTDFMGHPSVKHSNSAGAIGILGVKKTRDGVHLYFAHNTDSFAIASMHSDESKPVCTMSRSTGSGSIAQGGRAMRYRKKK